MADTEQENAPSSASDAPPRTPPVQLCDLVLKGGVTSGVVYPRAILTLAKDYRFKNIGGTSAGAIAAGLAAAAEFGRNSGGFDRLAQVANELPDRMPALFQPAPPLRPLFAAACSVVQKGSIASKCLRTVRALICGYWIASLLGALGGALLGTIAGLGAYSLTGWINGIPLFAVLSAPLGIVVAIALRAWVALSRQLPANQFGLCSGIGASESGSEALTTWLANELDRVAGLTGNAPLTFGDLCGQGGIKDPDIRLEVMTTCLAEGRPYRVPFETNRFMFREGEFRKLFPPRIVDWMLKHSRPVRRAEGFFRLPDSASLPVVVAIRLSLSFPLLLSAVPLHARDYTFRSKADRDVPRRCLFSDGGISSNFPIHFFDAPLPGHPTFAISLEDFDPARHDEHVSLPDDPRAGIQRPLRDVTNLSGFLLSMLAAMQNWQDNLRMRLPGYRDRVVSVRLDPSEGGLNFDMPPELIRALMARGEAAATRLTEDFDFNQHCWIRYLVWSAALERNLAAARSKYFGHAGYAGFIAGHDPEVYVPRTPQWRTETTQRMDELMQLLVSQASLLRFDDGHIPKPRTDLGLNPQQ